MTPKETKKKSRIKQSPKLPAEKRREQLITAAHELFLKRGYRATTTEEIARKAGVTKGALYFHFRSKEDIMASFVKQITDSFERAIDDLPDKKFSPADLLRVIRDIDQQLPLPESRRNLQLLSEIISIPRLKRIISTAYEHSMEAFTDLLDPAYGRTKTQRRRVVEVVHALYDGLCFAGMVHSDLGKFDRHIKTIESIWGKTRNGK